MRIEAEADVGARHDECGVEQIGERIEPRNPLGPRLRPGKIKSEVPELRAAHAR